MRTYVRMIFYTEGVSPRDVVPIMRSLGFEESLGMHDFVYKWKRKVKMDEVLEVIHKMHERLKGKKIGYEVTTVE
jgi:hypothetical protein